MTGAPTTKKRRRAEDRIDTTPRQLKRAELVLHHIARLGPAMRWWLRERIIAQECGDEEIGRLRRAGHQ